MKKSEEIKAEASQLFMQLGQNVTLQKNLRRDQAQLDGKLDELELAHQEALKAEAEAAQDASQAPSDADPSVQPSGADAPAQDQPSASEAPSA